MCDVLSIPRSTFYYEHLEKPCEEELVEVIKTIFKKSRNNYGTRKIKIELQKKNLTISRRRIGRLMKQQGLVSTYTIAQYKPYKSTVNEAPVKNKLNRAFDGQEAVTVVVINLT